MNFAQFNLDVPEDIRELIPEEKLEVLMEAFIKLDSDGDGKVVIDEYLEFALQKEKARLTKKFQSFDTDKDGSVTFEEYVNAVEPHFSILKRFRELDPQHNGLLSLDEAVDIADKLTLPLTREQIQGIMEHIDRNGDKQITYYEYLEAIAHIGFQ